MKFVTSIAIDITSKEIQIGLNQNNVNSDNIDSIILQLELIIQNGILFIQRLLNCFLVHGRNVPC